MTKSYIVICMRLLKELLILKHVLKCELCDVSFSEVELMPVHILTAKAHPKLRFYLPNIRLGCDRCHREEEKFGELRNLHGDNLKSKEIKIPLLKHQDSKNVLKKMIEELK